MQFITIVKKMKLIILLILKNVVLAGIRYFSFCKNTHISIYKNIIQFFLFK